MKAILISGLVAATALTTVPEGVAAATPKAKPATQKASAQPVSNAAGVANYKSPSTCTMPPIDPGVGSAVSANSYDLPSGPYFSYANVGSAQQNLRTRLRYTAYSVVGAPREGPTPDSLGNMVRPASTNAGVIRVASWSFNDQLFAQTLYDAYRRGVTVQVVAATDAVASSYSFKWLQRQLGSCLAPPGRPALTNQWSFVRSCKGSCRGPGGTMHSKYYLFDRFAGGKGRAMAFQSSMNPTEFAATSQWNQAQVNRRWSTYNSFMANFEQLRTLRDRPVGSRYVVRASDYGRDIFTPHPGMNSSNDLMIQSMNKVRCNTSRYGVNGRTRIRVMNYAFFGTRGQWLARKLRGLWNSGCNVNVIYGVTSGPVLSILRARSGRGPVPMKQSGTKDSRGNILKYNHSKWMSIDGNYGGRTQAAVLTGSQNWADLAITSDEQIQEVLGWGNASKYINNFNTTWSQRTSKTPNARVMPNGRMRITEGDYSYEGEPRLGEGIWKNMPVG